MPLDGRYDIALNSAHSHTQSKELQQESFARAAGSTHRQIAIFVLLGIKQIHDAKRIVVPVDTE